MWTIISRHIGVPNHHLCMSTGTLIPAMASSDLLYQPSLEITAACASLGRQSASDKSSERRMISVCRRVVQSTMDYFIERNRQGLGRQPIHGRSLTSTHTASRTEDQHLTVPLNCAQHACVVVGLSATLPRAVWR